jgi:hypothetical protein
MEKLDLRKELKWLYAPSARRVDIVDVPTFHFVMIDGEIERGQKPETSESFQEAVNILYGISFTLKFMSKLRKANPIDYRIMALEGLWWNEDGMEDFERKEGWHWTLMMLQPEHITEAMFDDAVSSLRKKRGEIPALHLIRFEPFHEGKCVQILHVGPYDLETMTLARMKDFARKQGYRFHGKHHEIYLRDPRRAKPEKLRTVLRRPIVKAPEFVPAQEEPVR